MLITNSFVMLNYPKTGSSFARKVIKQAYRTQQGVLERGLSKLGLVSPPVQEHFVVNQQVNIVDQHGRISDIPAALNDRHVVSIIRCPFDRYLSQYAYRWWVKHPPAPLDEIVAQYPAFPDLSFEQYYEMNWRWMAPKRLAELGLPALDVGTQTLQFIDFFFSNPREAAQKLLLEDDKDYLKEIKRHSFLHQENLNGELKVFLRDKAGIAEKHLQFIDSQQPVNVSRDKSTDIVAITPSLRRKIKQRDRLLFEIFPEYDRD